MINEEILEEILIESYKLGLTKELFKEVDRLRVLNNDIKSSEVFYIALENLKEKLQKSETN